MQAGLLGHEEQPPELTLRNFHRERRQRRKPWSQAVQLKKVWFERSRGVIYQRNQEHL